MFIFTALLLLLGLVTLHEIAMPKATILMLTKEHSKMKPYHYWDDLDIYLG